MPERLRKVNGKYQVYNADTREIHAKGTSKKKAIKQIRFLRGLKHGMIPRKQ
jgi:hypothetical protein